MKSPKKFSQSFHLMFFFFTFLHCSYYYLQGQGGGSGAAGGQGGHYHLGVDGLLSLLRVDAQYCHLCQGQVAGMNSVMLQQQ